MSEKSLHILHCRPVLKSTCYLFPFSLRKPYSPFSHRPLMHASWLHYSPAKASVWLSNPATRSAETSKAFALLPFPTQANPYGVCVGASTMWSAFHFNNFFQMHKMFQSREMDDHCWDLATRETLGKTNTHKFSCFLLQWLNTEHHVFCFCTYESCCLTPQRAVTPQAHDRLIT